MILAYFWNISRGKIRATKKDGSGLDWQQVQSVSIIVYNCLGMELYQESLSGKTEAEINLSHLESGTYFLSLSSKAQGVENKSVMKLIKI